MLGGHLGLDTVHTAVIFFDNYDLSFDCFLRVFDQFKQLFKAGSDVGQLGCFSVFWVDQ